MPGPVWTQYRSIMTFQMKSLTKCLDHHARSIGQSYRVDTPCAYWNSIHETESPVYLHARPLLWAISIVNLDKRNVLFNMNTHTLLCYCIYPTTSNWRVQTSHTAWHSAFSTNVQSQWSIHMAVAITVQKRRCHTQIRSVTNVHSALWLFLSVISNRGFSQHLTLSSFK